MPTEILMPALSPTMEEGKLAKWLVKEGQPVKAGDIIAEIETDKATMEVEAVDEGKVGKLLVAEGTEGVKVNTPIATLLADGESAARRATKAPSRQRDGGSPRLHAAPRQRPRRRHRRSAAEAARRAHARPPMHRPGHAKRGDGRVPAPTVTATARIFASPLARRLAKEAGSSSAALAGSGPHGRVVKRDVEAALQGRRRRAQPSAAPPVTAKRAAAPASLRPGDAGRQDPGALREGLLRGRPARRHAQGDRAAADAVEADHPALPSDASTAASTNCCARASA